MCAKNGCGKKLPHNENCCRAGRIQSAERTLASAFSMVAASNAQNR
jgi:hypothetical protein